MSRKKLLKLEKNNLYVFHGSPVGDIEYLEPRQGKNISDPVKSNETILDGKPAVSATPYVDFAIFRAIINKKNVPLHFSSGFGFKNSGMEFHVSSKDVLDQIKDKKGFVYVFYKNEFEPYSRTGKENKTLMEWRSYKKVKPIDVIGVNYNDLLLNQIRINEVLDLER